MTCKSWQKIGLSAWLAPLVVRCGRSAAQILQNGPQQPISSKTVLATLISLAVLLALHLEVCFGRSAAQILQNGPSQQPVEVHGQVRTLNLEVDIPGIQEMICKSWQKIGLSA